MHQSIYNNYMNQLKVTALEQMEVLKKYVGKADIEENFREIFDNLQAATDYQEATEYWNQWSKEMRNCGVADIVNHGVVDLRNESFKGE